MSAHDWSHAVSALGWTLVHFLWQGLAIALLLELWLFLARRRSARERYLARCLALASLASAPGISFAWLWTQEAATLARAEAATTTAALGESARALESSFSGWQTWIVVLWALGALLFGLRLSGGLWQVLHLRRRAVGAPLPPAWQVRFERLARDFGVHARARLVDSAAVAVPTAIGWLKPIVLLPARIFSGLSDAQIEALIAHELAHVARHDYLVNVAQSIVEALLFYHPAVWWVSRGIRVEREYCCDDRAVAATQDGLSFARALTALETWRGGELKLGVSTLGGSFMHRIQRLVGAEADSRAHARPFHALGALLALVSMGASAFGFATWPEPAAAHDCKCCCHHRHARRSDFTRAEPTTDPRNEGAEDQNRWRAYLRGSGELRIGSEIIPYLVRGKDGELQVESRWVLAETEPVLLDRSEEPAARVVSFHLKSVTDEFGNPHLVGKLEKPEPKRLPASGVVLDWTRAPVREGVVLEWSETPPEVAPGTWRVRAFPGLVGVEAGAGAVLEIQTSIDASSGTLDVKPVLIRVQRECAQPLPRQFNFNVIIK
jgi:beta-lactamase regulating signal transducer with metallopeptidase domain